MFDFEAAAAVGFEPFPRFGQLFEAGVADRARIPKLVIVVKAASSMPR